MKFKARTRPWKFLLLVSALLGILSTTAWVVSARRTSFWMSQFGDTLGLKGGCVILITTTSTLRERLAGQLGVGTVLQWSWNTGPRVTPLEWLPPLHNRSPTGRRQIILPLWPIVLASGIVVFICARWLRRRNETHACPRCRYPLAGLAENTACPECGTITTTSTPRA
jgi:hypothetical protein